MIIKDKKIAIIGLGYVGLPLAIEFSKKYKVIGFDINKDRISELLRGFDRTNEVEINVSTDSTNIQFSSDLNKIKSCNIFIITVPTPIDDFKNPDLKPLFKATEMIGTILKKGDIVIYESTVYPGCTEEECVPLLEKNSNLLFNKDFFCGYSPERINPGDKVNTITKIIKVTSGSNNEVAEIIDNLYGSIIVAGTHKAPSIKVAEASKAIENAQRDLNISFVNELALMFDLMNIDTSDVIEAAATKWNFLKFMPGLVGGHCIGVDPYYLAHKAKSLGYYPEVILSGRRVNDYMGMFIANKIIKLLIHKKQVVKGAKVLLLGFTFKEDCSDVRNTRVIDIYNELNQFGLNIDVFDPIADQFEVIKAYNISLINTFVHSDYQAVILAVKHTVFQSINFKKFKDCGALIYDTKSIIQRELVDSRL